MKKIIFILCILSMVIFSCSNDDDKTKDPPDDTEQKPEDPEEKVITALQNAFFTKKEIVSAKDSLIEEIKHQVLTFSDNIQLNLPDSMIDIFNYEEDVNLYYIKLVRGYEFVFNSKTTIDPTYVIIALQNAFFAKKEIVSVTDTLIEEIKCKVLTFPDNINIYLPDDMINVFTYDEETGLYFIKLSEGHEFTFNRKTSIDPKQVTIALQNAFFTKKELVSATEALVEEIKCQVLTFSDNIRLYLPNYMIDIFNYNEETDLYYIKLLEGFEFTFNSKITISPTGLVVLRDELKMMKNTEVSIEFRVNPANAIFNYDVSSDDCQIALDMAGKLNTYSYVTEPENCRLTRIEPAKDINGQPKEGQYRAYIQDNGHPIHYKYAMTLVLSTKDNNEEETLLSSPAFTITRKKDTNLPIVEIHTENNQEILDKENWISGTMAINGIGEFDDYEGTISIRGRGNSTWLYNKKPYAIKLDTKSEILGMPKHKRWVLLANYIDRTLLRNHVAFEIAKRTGLEWTPRGQFVEVMLNNIHLGNYYLCEQIKVDDNRVNIKEMNSSDVDDESITGGYLLEMDTYYDEVNKFKSAVYNFPVMIKDPDEDVLTTEQFEYIRNYIDSTEILLAANDFDVTRKYASRIADTTFIDWWFVMELVVNNETMHPKSSYLYKDRSGVLKAGPVWDFDWNTFQNSTHFCTKEAIWYPQLFKDPVFVYKVKARWDVFKPSFEQIITLMKDMRNKLTISAELNDEMWSLLTVESINGDEHLTYYDAVERMITNYQNRLKWLDRQIKNM